MLTLNNPSPGTILPDSNQLDFSAGLTVEAWVDMRESRAEAWQEIVGQWQPLETWGEFEAYDAGFTSGLETIGFFGAVFDGRYVYFVPQHDRTTRHGRVLRYDTHAGFKDPDAWQGYDAGQTDGLETKGYYGAVFDGRFVYFVPRRTAETFHSRVLRLDTRGGFQDKASWAAYDAGLDRSYQSAAFDGRYIYFTPGHRAVHKSEVDDPEACASPPVTGMDPDYVLLGNSLVLRHDTRGEFKDPANWTTHDAAGTDGLNTCDYDGAVFDGRFVYYIPYYDGGTFFHGITLRHDTRGDFDDPASWSCRDAGQTDGLTTVGFNGGAFDGRFIYYAAWIDGECEPGKTLVGNGRIPRYDTLGDQGSFSLRYADCGHNGGLNASAPGPRFIVNTAEGARSAAAHQMPEAGRHHLVGTYDGRELCLYLDGECVARQAGGGSVTVSRAPLRAGGETLPGTIEHIAIATTAHHADWVRERFRAGAAA